MRFSSKKSVFFIRCTRRKIRVPIIMSHDLERFPSDPKSSSLPKPNHEKRKTKVVGEVDYFRGFGPSGGG